eukprot:jgi/Tetstr1/435147/TSEL_002607.t1
MKNLEQGLSTPFQLFTWKRGGGRAGETVAVIWRIPRNRQERDEDIAFQLQTRVLNNITRYHTRLRKALFLAHVVNPTFIKTKAAAQAVYEYITSDRLPKQRAAGHDHAILMSELALSCQDFDIITDLRELNGRPTSDLFDPFWDALAELMAEHSRVHDRRWGDVSYLAAAFSTRDLVEQVVDKLKEKHHPQTLLEAGVHIPSISWVQYQFAPKHPSYRASLQYTARVPVKWKVQVRAMRAYHADAKYVAALFKYIRKAAVLYANIIAEHTDHDCVPEEVVFYSVDDKSKVNVGEPNLPITFGGVARKGIMPADVTNVAGDHDFHKVSLTPSVALEVVIKPHEGEGDGLQSFYRGQCHVVLKDSVFQPSTPLRHAAELMSIARSCSMRGDITRGTPGVAFIMSDGGPDHNVSFYTVIAAWLALFMELEMDVLTISRTAPTQSYMNCAERCMSELNRGLQNNALARARVDDDFEKAFARCNSMTAIRAAAAKALNEELQAEADDEPMPPLAEDSDSDEEEAGDTSSSSEAGTDMQADDSSSSAAAESEAEEGDGSSSFSEEEPGGEEAAAAGEAVDATPLPVGEELPAAPAFQAREGPLVDYASSSSEAGSDMSVTAEEDHVVESLAALKAGPAAAATRPPPSTPTISTFQKSYEASVAPVISTIDGIFQRLMWAGQRIQTHTPADSQSMQALLKRLHDIDPTLESLKLDSSSINKHPELRRVIDNHTIGGPYMRQYFKQPLVDDCQCKACQLGLWGVLRLPAAAYADIVNHKVPLPIP